MENRLPTAGIKYHISMEKNQSVAPASMTDSKPVVTRFARVEKNLYEDLISKRT